MGGCQGISMQLLGWLLTGSSQKTLSPSIYLFIFLDPYGLDPSFSLPVLSSTRQVDDKTNCLCKSNGLKSNGTHLNTPHSFRYHSYPWHKWCGMSTKLTTWHQRFVQITNMQEQ